MIFSYAHSVLRRKCFQKGLLCYRKPYRWFSKIGYFDNYKKSFVAYLSEGGDRSGDGIYLFNDYLLILCSIILQSDKDMILLAFLKFMVLQTHRSYIPVNKERMGDVENKNPRHKNSLEIGNKRKKQHLIILCETNEKRILSALVSRQECFHQVLAKRDKREIIKNILGKLES